MHQKKACIIYSYPQGSFHGEQMLATVKKTLEDDRTEHSLINLYEMNFNPVMSAQEVATYGKQIPLEITRQQEILRASDLWIFIYPVWWSTPPAILKGWIDRVLTPRFAYDMRGGQIAPLLMNKRALIIRTYSYSALHEQKTGNVAKNFMENCVLASCGVKSLAIDVFSINSLAESAFKHTLGYIPGAVRRMLVEYTVVPHHLRSIPAPYLPPIEERKKPAQDEVSDVDGKVAKPKLSAQAEDDLNFFRHARKKARENVNRRSERNEATRYMFSEDATRRPPEYGRQTPTAYAGRSSSGYTGRQPAGYTTRQADSSHSRDANRRPASPGYLGRSPQAGQNPQKHSRHKRQFSKHGRNR